MATVKIAPDLYSRPPKSAPEGLQSDYRSINLVAADLVSTQLIAMAVIPAGHRLTLFGLESSDLDSHGTPTIKGSVGILNSYYGAALNAAPALVAGKNVITDSTVFQAGGRAAPVLAFSQAIGVDKVNDRILALEFTTEPATAATTGIVGFIVGTQQD